MSFIHLISSEIKRIKDLYYEDSIIQNESESHVDDEIDNQLHNENNELEEKISKEQQRRIFYNYAILYKTKLPDDIEKEHEADREQKEKEKQKAWEVWKEQHRRENKLKKRLKKRNKSEKIDREKFEELEDKKKNVEREWYVYTKLHEKGIENTNIEKLLDLVIQDIQHQYSVKQDTENKIGFITALWGVTVSAVITSNLPARLIEITCNCGTCLLYNLFSMFALCGLVITGLWSLFLIGKAMIKGGYGKYLFYDKEVNFRCAVDDKYISMTRLLEGNTTVWKRNEDINKEKYEILRKLMLTIILFMTFIVISYGVCVILEKNKSDVPTYQKYTYEEEQKIDEENKDKNNPQN